MFIYTCCISRIMSYKHLVVFGEIKNSWHRTMNEHLVSLFLLVFIALTQDLKFSLILHKQLKYDILQPDNYWRHCTTLIKSI